ncbi:MAG: hypothetical protein RIC55_12360, partial [Pirellulaceae bacterium]
TQYFGTGVSGSTFQGNMYTGKGDGDFLDYGVEIGGGAANIQVLGNMISDNRGVASSDGSVSAGVLISTFFAPGSSAFFQDNTFTDNSNGLFIGFGATDTSAAQISSGNQFLGGTNGIVVSGAGTSLVGDTLSNTSFMGQTGNYVELRNGALFAPGAPTIIDASAVNFDNLDKNNTTNLLFIENKLVHYPDDNTLGLIGFLPASPSSLINQFWAPYDRTQRYQDFAQSMFDMFPGGSYSASFGPSPERPLGELTGDSSP